MKYFAPFLSRAHGKGLWTSIADCVKTDERTDLELRVLWGNVRYALGCDDRFDPNNFHLLRERFEGHSLAEEPLPGFVRIPAGTFSMGGGGDKSPTQRGIQQTFYISRTLVTVNQYAAFMSEGGYEDESNWWDEQGINWRRGWFDSQVKDDAYKDHLIRQTFELRLRPMRWDEQKANGNHPVWAVNWFEARAYARWLNAKLASCILSSSIGPGYSVMLPTELQWERAARAASLTSSDNRIWPWGDQPFDARQHAHLVQKISGVCAVGLFPPNAIGLYDLAGNVWEWMDNFNRGEESDFARVERNRTSENKESLNKSYLPALRGGSSCGSPSDARCSERARYSSSDWDDYLGFRVVISRPN